MNLLRSLSFLVLASWAPWVVGQSDVLSDDVIFDAPNPFAENLEQQGITSEFNIGGGDAGNFEDLYANPFAAPDFDPNADVLGDFNAKANLSAETDFIESLGSDAAPVPEPRSQRRGLQNKNDDRDLPPLVGGRNQAKLAVMKHACSSGGTIERCMQLRALMPDFKDKGWAVRVLSENDFVVERVLLLNGTLPLTYSWQVNKQGKVEATTIRAEMITELPLEF